MWYLRDSVQKSPLVGQVSGDVGRHSGRLGRVRTLPGPPGDASPILFINEGLRLTNRREDRRSRPSPMPCEASPGEKKLAIIYEQWGFLSTTQGGSDRPSM